MNIKSGGRGCGKVSQTLNRELCDIFQSGNKKARSKHNTSGLNVVVAAVARSEGLEPVSCVQVFDQAIKKPGVNILLRA